MKRISWREPNYRIEVSEPNSAETYWTLTSGATEDEAKESLISWGLTVHTVLPYDFKAWVKTSRQKTAAAIRQFRKTGKLEIDNSFWKELKDYFFRLFQGTCAFCESKVQHVDFGDVEHFRPKKGVVGEPDHRGYYWLAYDYRNWLPACSVCNTRKGNRFLITGKRAFRPHHQLSSEKPLLLHPFFDVPGEHLAFCIDSAQILCLAKARTPQGQETIDTCKLNRSELALIRKGAWDRTIEELETAALSRQMRDVDDIVSRARAGLVQYSGACMSAIKEFPQIFSQRITDKFKDLGI